MSAIGMTGQGPWSATKAGGRAHNLLIQGPGAEHVIDRCRAVVGPGSQSRLPGFKSQLCHLGAEQPGASFLFQNFDCFSFIIDIFTFDFFQTIAPKYYVS